MTRRHPAFWIFALIASCDRTPEPAFRSDPVAVRSPEPETPTETAAIPPEEGELLVPIDVPALFLVDPAARTLVLDPGDLMTATFDGVPTVGIPARGLSERDVTALSRDIELVTWPEREHVEVTYRYLNEALENSPYSRIAVEPVRPLSERWYALRVRAATRFALPDPVVSPRDGEWIISRFHLSPLAIIRRIYARAREDGGGDVQVVFSERVGLEAVSIAIAASGRRTDCRVGNAETLGRTGATVVWLDCASLPEGARVEVTETAVLTALDGRPIRETNGVLPLSSLRVALEPVPLGIAEPPHDLVGEERPVDPPFPSRRFVAAWVPSFGLAETPVADSP